ncbi:sugar ABC transporter substrate-binding protein [Litorilinea aerophila]|uniref:Sugar ABC transporter substrate-binding protein n=1 Tax=Litorilinea aerophila TaxID=1204385 RepID=A0A540VCF9_9CHLR|nr:sugar ABC transporter substrate-binding protein [Litorilinea aerophila]MCC9077826.1 sugar ABC transporter substrate-binding protein [Litorilinea aerophila]GIV78985.1 MAG: sugar ABC transporter substrate-binding protein [Litorilinea sp.]
MNIRTLRSLIWLVAVALFLAGCPAAPVAPGGQAPASSAGEGKVQIKLATWAGVDEANELQAILDELNAASETYEIIQESSPAEYWTKLQTTVAAGTAADLMWMDQEHLPDFAARGALLDITDRLENDDHPAADLTDYFPAALERYTYQGKHYGLPWIAMPVMLYVNLDHLEAAGYSEDQVNDWTWADFAEACVAMTLDSNGNHPGDSDFDRTEVQQYGFSIVPGWPPLQMWIWQAGGEVISEDLTQSPIDTPEALQGAQYVADLVASGCTPEQSVISERGFGEMMKAGTVSMFMGGAADDFERTEGKRIKAFLLPQGPVSRDTWAWIGGMSINANTANPDVAYEAFMDLTEAIHHWKVPAPRRSLATREGIVAATPYKEISADNIIANMEHMRAPRIFPGYAQWATVFGERYVDPLVRGNATPEELAGEVRPLLEEILAEAGQ